MSFKRWFKWWLRSFSAVMFFGQKKYKSDAQREREKQKRREYKRRRHTMNYTVKERKKARSSNQILLDKIGMPDDIPYLFHLDYSSKMAKLSELELKYLYNKIQSDLANCRIQIEANERRVPKFAVIDGETTIGAKHRWYEKCQEWLKKSLELQKEEELLEECESIVSDIVESGAHNGIVSTYADDTLYVHKGLLKCERDHHLIKQATAIMINKYGKDIKLNVSYCSECKKYFIHYDVYKHYREVYGPILGNIKMSKMMSSIILDLVWQKNLL